MVQYVRIYSNLGNKYSYCLHYFLLADFFFVMYKGENYREFFLGGEIMWNKSLFSILFLVGFTAGFVSPANAGGATVIKEFGCVILPSDSGLTDYLFTNDTHSVETPSGVSILQCHFDIPDGLEPYKTMKHEGFPCNTYLGLTYDSKSITTKGGKVHLM